MYSGVLVYGFWCLYIKPCGGLLDLVGGNGKLQFSFQSGSEDKFLGLSFGIRICGCCQPVTSTSLKHF